jgi:hypothetical protein
MINDNAWSNDRSTGNGSFVLVNIVAIKIIIIIIGGGNKKRKKRFSLEQ